MELENCRRFFSNEYMAEWDPPEITDILTNEERNKDYIDEYEIRFE